MGYELPPVVVSTAALEARIKPLYDDLRIPEGQLAYLTGIRERRWWEPETRLAPLAAAAAERALEAAGVPTSALGAVVYGSVCREDHEPATACEIAHLLGAPEDAAVYDLANACLGMLSGILAVANMIELGQIRAGVVVGCESAREINDAMIAEMLAERSMAHFTKAIATLTGGSGAASVVLTDGSFGTKGPRLAGGALKSAPAHHGLCRWGPDRREPPRQRMVMETDAVQVLKHGVPLGARTWSAFLPAVGWDVPDKTVCHQVGQANRTAILEAIGVGPEKDFTTFEYLGNTGSVAVPLTAALAAERGVLVPGQRVAWLGIGSGLNCLMLGWEW
jgi:3-oxoacyl-[acyl-carrier-protein] synthase-3